MPLVTLDLLGGLEHLGGDQATGLARVGKWDKKGRWSLGGEGER